MLLLCQVSDNTVHHKHLVTRSDDMNHEHNAERYQFQFPFIHLIT